MGCRLDILLKTILKDNNPFPGELNYLLAKTHRTAIYVVNKQNLAADIILKKTKR